MAACPLLVGQASRADLPPDFSKEADRLFQSAMQRNEFAGASVFFVDAHGETFKAHYGFRDQVQKRPADDHTLYEIGSISKTFTRLLLATQSDVALSDPLSKYLPVGVKAPRPSNQELRVQDLALHTGFAISVPCVFGVGGEPICFNFVPAAPGKDPYREMTQASLFQFVTAYADWVAKDPTRFPAPGKYYAYSNVGMGLLGELLALRQGTTYRALLKSAVLAPLGMTDTDMDLECESQGNCPNLAEVYHRVADGGTWEAGQRWHLPALNGAGGIRSSLGDMAIYLKAQLGLLPEYPLQSAILASHRRLSDAEADLEVNACVPSNPNRDACNRYPQDLRAYLGWPSVGNRSIFFHAGETGNSQSMIAFSQDLQAGVVILANSRPGAEAHAAVHVPNALALCILQLAGKDVGFDACAFAATD